MQPLSCAIAAAFMCHRSSLRWHMKAAVFFRMLFNDTKLFWSLG